MDKDVRYDVLFVNDEVGRRFENAPGMPTQAAPTPEMYFPPGKWTYHAVQPFYVYQPTTVYRLQIWLRGSGYMGFVIPSLYKDDMKRRLWGGESVPFLTGEDWTANDIAVAWRLTPGLYLLGVFLRSIAPLPAMPLQLGVVDKKTRLPLHYVANTDLPDAPYPNGLKANMSLAFDLAAGETEHEALPLLLAEQGGALAFHVSASPPVTGKLVQGDLQESDLSQAWTVRTQNDWSGGRGQSVAYGPTDRYADGLADTRFPHQVILPPAPRLNNVGGGGVGFTPDDSVAATEIEVTSASGSVLVNVPDFVDTAAGVQTQTGMKGKTVEAKWTATAVAEHVKNTQPVAGQSPGSDMARLEYDLISNSPPNLQSEFMGQGYGYWDKPEWLLESLALFQGDMVAAPIHSSANGLLLNGQRLSRVKLRMAAGTAGTYFFNFRLCRSMQLDGVAIPDENTTLVFADRHLTLTTSMQEIEIDFAPVQLDPNTTYWFFLNVVATAGAAVAVSHYAAQSGTPSGYICLRSILGGTLWHPVYQKALWYKFLWAPEFEYANRRGADVAQSFVSAQPIQVRNVRLNLRKGDTWRGDLTWAVEVQNDTGGAPSGTALPGCRWVKPAALTTAYQTLTLTPGEATTLAANTRYWLVVKVASEAANGTDGRIAGAVEVECDNAAKYADGAAWKRALTGQTLGQWQEQARDLYFHVGNFTRTRTRLAQSFVLPDAAGLGGLNAIQVTQVRVRATSYTTSGSGVVTLRVHHDNGGVPGAQIAAGTLSATPEGPLGGWYKAELTTAVTMNAGATYWLVADASAPNELDASKLTVLADGAKTYAGGVGLLQEGAGNPISFGDWQAGDADMYFQLGTGSPVVWGPYYRAGNARRQRVAQQFQIGGNNLTLTKVMLYLRRQVWMNSSSPALTVSVWTNTDSSHGERPGAPIGGATGALTQAMLPQAPGWVQVPISATLAANTKYWLVLEASGYEVNVAWLGEGGQNPQRPAWLCMSNEYANGAWIEEWSPWDVNLYFMLNDGGAFGFGVDVTPVEYAGEWYVASGPVVYRFNRTAQQWASFATLSATVTALEVYGGKLFAALGDATDMQQFDGSTFSAVSGRKFTFLLAAGGYLNALRAAGGPQALGYYNGSAWTGLDCGTADHAFTGMAWYRDTLIVFSTIEVLSHTGHYSVRVIDYRQMRSPRNGRQAVTWGGMLVYPVRNSLYAWDGSVVQGIGPDMDEGMPSKEQGPISAMVSTPNWLFVAVDGGASGHSTVLARGRHGNWHKLVRMDVPGQRITAMGYEAFTNAAGTPRLHFFAGSNAWYLQLPDVTDNPWGYAGATFKLDGWVQSSRLLGELSQIDKDIQSIGLRTQGCSADQRVEVYLEVDQSGHWWYLGDITRSPWQILDLVAPAMTPKVVAEGSTDRVLVLEPGQRMDDMLAGQFVRVGSDVAQVDSVDLSGERARVTLVRALSETPTPGTMVYPSRPVGREVRYRLVLRTADQAKTPRVEGVSVTYQEMFLDRFRFTMTIRLESNAKGRTGGKYPLTPAEVRRRMYEWLRRPTPFILVGPDGRRWRVKILSFSESGFTRETGQDRRESDAEGVGSMMTVNLIEV